MKKFIIALMTAVTMLFGSVPSENTVSAEEYEKNILISCESKEIDINDIPENREVELNVSIENNPGFILLGLYAKYDLRLRKDNYRICKGADDLNDEVFGPDLYYEDGRDEYVKIQISSKNQQAQNNGIIMKFVFAIPDDAKPGDEYKVDFILKDEHAFFYLYPNSKFICKEDYFIEPVDGYIKIVGNTNEIEVKENNDEPQTNNDNKIESDNTNIHDEPSITESTELTITEEITKTTYISTVASTSLSNTEDFSIISVSETIVTTTSIPSLSTEAIASEESTSQNSTSVTVKTEQDESNKRSYVIPIALSAMIVAAVAVVIAKRKRSK